MHLGKKISIEMYEQGSPRNSRLPFVLDWFLPPRLLYEESGEKRSLAMSTTQKAENYGLTIIH